MSILRRFIPEGKHKIFLACVLGSVMLSFTPLQAKAANVISDIPKQQMGVIFDADYYAEHYADLKKAFGNDKDALYEHFVTYGMKEGRNASPNFNMQNYKVMYADLQKAFGDDLTKYYEHFVTYGLKEGRSSGIENREATSENKENSEESQQSVITEEIGKTEEISVDNVTIWAEEGVSGSCIDEIRGYLQLIPNPYIEKFVENEWKIQITKEPINTKYAGFAIYGEKKIYICKDQLYSIVHEMGHFVDYSVSFSISNDSNFQDIKTLYYQDIATFFKGIYGDGATSDYISYYRDLNTEFFAFCFDYTYNLRDRFNEKFPKAFDFIKSLS